MHQRVSLQQQRGCLCGSAARELAARALGAGAGSKQPVAHEMGGASGFWVGDMVTAPVLYPQPGVCKMVMSKPQTNTKFVLASPPNWQLF